MKKPLQEFCRACLGVLFFCVFLTAVHLVSAMDRQHRRLPFQPLGGCAYDMCEGFEGTDYEQAWSEVDTDNILDPDHTTTVHTGSESLEIDGNATSTDGYTTHTLAADENSGHGRMEIYTGSGQAHNQNHNLICYDNSDLEVFFIRWKQQNPGLTILWQSNGGSSQSVSGFSEDTWLCIEWGYTNGSLVIKVDGSEQTTSTGGNDRNIRKFRLGTQDTDNMDTYIDEFVFDSGTSHIGCAP